MCARASLKSSVIVIESSVIMIKASVRARLVEVVGGYAVVTRWLHGGYTVVTRWLHGVRARLVEVVGDVLTHRAEESDQC